MTTSLPEPDAARARGAVLTGIHAELIEVAATAGTGPPGFAIICVPEDQTGRPVTGSAPPSSTATSPGRPATSP